MVGVLAIALEASHWEFRMEGASNIVLGYTGPRSHLEGCVLRVLKTTNEGAPQPNDGGERVSCVELEHAYNRNVVRPLLAQWMPLEALVGVDEPFLAELNTRTRPHRPPHRLHKRIDTTQRVATLLADLARADLVPSVFPLRALGVVVEWRHEGREAIACNSRQHRTPLSDQPKQVPRQTTTTSALLQGTGCCIEIKPKCGFVREGTICDYCMMQYLKHKRGSIRTVNHYCPVELFSDDEERMVAALQALAPNPQNNLRIFKDGALVEPCAVGDLDELLRECVRALRASGLLPALLKLQRLHSFSFERIHHAHVELQGRQAGSAATDRDARALVAPWWRVPRDATFAQRHAGDGVWLGEWDGEGKGVEGVVGYGALLGHTRQAWLHDPAFPLARVPDHQLLGALAAFLISTSAKDASVMVWLSTNNSEHANHASNNSDHANHPLSRVFVVDVAPKSTAKLAHYVKQARDIKTAYDEQA